MDPLLLLALLPGAVALGAAAWWARRRRGSGRAMQARALCALLDRYLDGIRLQETGGFDADAQWSTLEQARALQREHFPELFAEMIEVSRTHRELTELRLRGHMERHGAPTNWSTLEAPSQLAAAHALTAATVRALQAGCRAAAGLKPDS